MNDGLTGMAFATHATDIKSIIVSRKRGGEQCHKDFTLALHGTLAVRSGVDPTF